jgi:hypothetical protein
MLGKGGVPVAVRLTQRVTGESTIELTGSHRGKTRKRFPMWHGGFGMRRVLVTIAILALAVLLGLAAAGCKKSSSGGGGYMGRSQVQATSSA